MGCRIILNTFLLLSLFVRPISSNKGLARLDHVPSHVATDFIAPMCKQRCWGFNWCVLRNLPHVPRAVAGSVCLGQAGINNMGRTWKKCCGVTNGEPNITSGSLPHV